MALETGRSSLASETTACSILGASSGPKLTDFCESTPQPYQFFGPLIRHCDDSCILQPTFKLAMNSACQVMQRIGTLYSPDQTPGY